MIVTDKSIIITIAVPVFLFLIIVEYFYGLKVGKNNYKLADTFTSLGLGLISRFLPMLNIGFQGAVFVYVGANLNLKLLPLDNPLTWIVGFLLYDLSYYWMHRMHHEIKILWATHSVHHHGEEYNLSTALRQTSTGWLWKWVFYLPMIMVGVPGEVFVTVAGINLVYQFWVHTKHIGHLGFLEKIFITPMNHGVHHAKNEEYIDANYGGVFIIWDRMFRDTIHTKKLSNKIKIWYSSTSWRPEDLIENSPAQAKNSIEEKFNPPLNTQQKIFGMIQIFSVTILAGIVATTQGAQTYQETAIFGLILLLSVTLTSSILQNKINSSNIQFGVSGLLIFIIYLGGIVNVSLLASQFVIVYSAINFLYLGITIAMQRVILADPVN